MYLNYFPFVLKLLFLSQQHTHTHTHNPTVYWIHEKQAIIKKTIQPNESAPLITVLSHEWWVRDATTDTHQDIQPNLGKNQLTDMTCLWRVKILLDTRTEYIIPRRTCYDKSGHCPRWNMHGQECTRNPVFMHKICPVTCQQCTQHKVQEEETEDEKKEYEQEQETSHEHNTTTTTTTTTNRHDGEEL